MKYCISICIKNNKKLWYIISLFIELKQELYNRYHASLRSVIERTFGVWKKRRVVFDIMHIYFLYNV